MKQIGIAKQRLVYLKTNYKCAYCGEELNLIPDDPSRGAIAYNFGIDHVIPRSKGGSNELENLLPCCRSCNSRKATRSLEEFRLAVRVKENGAPPFSKEQLEYLKDKVDLDILFPKKDIVFYFETLRG